MVIHLPTHVVGLKIVSIMFLLSISTTPICTSHAAMVRINDSYGLLWFTIINRALTINYYSMHMN